MSEQIQLTASFEQIDRNHDQMLFRDEVRTFIERDLIATQSRIEISVRQDGKTLFKLLDANVDRRLTTRELREGFVAVAQYDRNGDHKLSESELGTAYSLQIGLGQADSLRLDSMSSMNMTAQSTDAILPGLNGLTGPEWFRRMDRNQDRDVSWREFLGPRSTFQKLDTDNDGLLSASEAERLTDDSTSK
jgi:Ca2+-binding EF-hand superfamily protein